MDRGMAKEFLETFQNRMASQLRENFEIYAGGGPCTHAFCMGDDLTRKLDCMVCGKFLGYFNPSVDRVGMRVPVPPPEFSGLDKERLQKLTKLGDSEALTALNRYEERR